MFLLAIVLACGDLCSPQAMFWYDHLLAEGGYGRFQRERAAFLVRESDGTLTLEPWPAGDFRRASFRGVVPAGAIAIVHTHPMSDPRPSVHDRDEAQRLEMTIVVVTPASVIASRGDGAHVILRRADAAGPQP